MRPTLERVDVRHSAWNAHTGTRLVPLQRLLIGAIAGRARKHASRALQKVTFPTILQRNASDRILHRRSAERACGPLDACLQAITESTKRFYSHTNSA